MQPAKQGRQQELFFVIIKTGYSNGIICTHEKAPQVRRFWHHPTEFSAPFSHVMSVCGAEIIKELEEIGMANISITQMNALSPNALS